MSGTIPVCPCDGLAPPAPTNLPELLAIAYRVGTWASFRQAVLTPCWRRRPGPGASRTDPRSTASRSGAPIGAGDLAVMIAEWFAYIADILTFYNERIANEDLPAHRDAAGKRGTI